MSLLRYSDMPRLLNHFSIGADPEFVFTLPPKNEYVHAETIGGYNTLEAFGCDMAGRQAEIRAYPSRSALHVVASIMDSLRWMSYKGGPDVYKLNWRAMAWNGRDGCGGHVHLGRKTSNRKEEIEVLDTVTMALLDANILNKGLNEFRASQTPYGKLQDWRMQPHGYEYRSLPTSLASPLLTYFVLVITKLAVLERFRFNLSATVQSQIWSLLAAHVKVDQDAAILLRALERQGMPADDQSDFKARWGIPVAAKSENKVFYPSIIPPTTQTCRELFDHFVYGLQLPARIPSPVWEPFLLPKCFGPIGVQPHTQGHLPDVGANLLSRNCGIWVALGDYFYVTGATLPFAEIKSACEKEGLGAPIFQRISNPKNIRVSVTNDMCKSQLGCRKLKNVLSNPELFPACKANLWNKIDWSKWDNPQKPKEPKYLGKLVVAQESGEVEPRPTPGNKTQQMYVQYVDEINNWAQQPVQQAPAPGVQILAQRQQRVPRPRPVRPIDDPEEGF